MSTIKFYITSTKYFEFQTIYYRFKKSVNMRSENISSVYCYCPIAFQLLCRKIFVLVVHKYSTQLNSITLVENCGKILTAHNQLNTFSMTVGKRSPMFRLCDKHSYFIQIESLYSPSKATCLSQSDISFIFYKEPHLTYTVRIRMYEGRFKEALTL